MALHLCVVTMSHYWFLSFQKIHTMKKKQSGIWLDFQDAYIINLLGHDQAEVRHIHSDIHHVATKGGSRSQSKVVLYDTKRKKWKTVGKGGNLYPDPETLPLSSGNLGVYFWFAGEDTTKYMTVRP